MNDLGVLLAWSAVQVTLVLVPAVGVYLAAARRGPGSGAWVAALSLGFVVVLGGLAFVPRRGFEASAAWVATLRPVVEKSVAGPSRADRGMANPLTEKPTDGPGWTLARLRRAWLRFETGAATPADRCRRWGSALAIAVVVGTAAGLLRLLVGLWAVHLCRVRSRPVFEPELIGLAEELRRAMGCRRTVEIREAIDLTTPATAGFWRVVILLPADWRSWDARERRAVLAHELAHVCRKDYATGLLARLALALHFYHPLVHWLTARLQLDQELAADAFGAKFAGGRQPYLQSLSRLALRQDGQSPCWPARAFLPVKGTLIRRIAMLRDDRMSMDRPWSGAKRLLTVLTLLALTLGVAMLRGPALGADEGKANDPKSAVATPFAPYYLGDDMAGVVAFRPASAFQRKEIGRLKQYLVTEWGFDLSHLPKDVWVAKGVKVDTTRPDFVKLDFADIEWVMCGLKFGRAKSQDGKTLHRFEVGGGLTVRTVAAFDWLAFCRQWHQGLTEVREGGRRYYKVDSELLKALGWKNPCIYLPDDRTLVLEEEKAIRKLVSREVPALPAFLRSADWERASHGLLAIAINNQDGAFAKQYDLGRPDDAVVLSLFKDVDHWIFSVDDADAIAMHATALCQNNDAPGTITSAIESLLKLGRDLVDQDKPKSSAEGVLVLAHRMTTTLLANLRVQSENRSVRLMTQGFGTLDNVATLIQAEADAQSKHQKERIGKAEPKRATR